MKWWLALIGATLWFVAFASIASAHAKVDHCTPAGGATVATTPSRVVCVMTEEIDTKASTMSVFDENSSQVDKKDAHVDLNDPDHKTLIVSLDTSKINNRIYTVKWHVVTPDDSGISDGTFQFVVGSAAVTPQPTTEILQEATATPSGEMQMEGTPAAGTPVPNAKIHIVEPKDGSTLPPGVVRVQVSVEGAQLGPIYHWHLDLDGKMMDMVMNGGTSDTTQLDAGAHELKAALADSTHDELTSDTIHITVAAPAVRAITQPTTAASPTAIPLATVPTTGAAENNAWLIVMALGLFMIVGGIGLAVKVRR